MPRLWIDDREVEVPVGSTILIAARTLGLDIPTLCFLEGLKPATSCLVCLVKVCDTGCFVPSCATMAEDGMRIESETAEVHQLRKTSLELLLSDHVGDCIAPCQNACSSRVDIPLMLHRVAAGQFREAMATIRNDQALSAVLGYLGVEPSERVCRRAQVDSPVAIGMIKRQLAEADLRQTEPTLPQCEPSTGKQVAVVGAGPTGLSACYHLLRLGHGCTIFDSGGLPGGTLRNKTNEESLPRWILDGEIDVIRRMGAEFRMRTCLGRDATLAELKTRFNAVLLAVGTIREDGEQFDVPLKDGRIVTDQMTCRTVYPDVFAAGAAVRPGGAVHRAVADGKSAAISIHQYLCGQPVTGLERPWMVRAGKLSDGELTAMVAAAGHAHRVVPAGGSQAGFTGEEAMTEAARCLRCDCAKMHDCRLRKYAMRYGAEPGKYRGVRRLFERHVRNGLVVFEPGKCILCGLCVQIATEAKEPLGLTFIGRGFDVRIGVPFNAPLSEALMRTARDCVAACPTGAIIIDSNPAIDRFTPG